MPMAIGWRVEMGKPEWGMRRVHEDFEASDFASAMKWAENAGKHFPFVSVAPIFPPDRIRDPLTTDCAKDCPVFH
jgi:hypothetical protein